MFYYLAQCSSCTRIGYGETKKKHGTQKSHNDAIFIQSKVWNTENYLIYFVVVNAEVYKNEGNDEYNKKNFNSAIHFYTEGIKVNCKDEDLNAKLYSNRGQHILIWVRCWFILAIMVKLFFDWSICGQ